MRFGRGCSKSKLYRFDNGEWKERGVGQLKLLEHKESKKIRLLFRQEKTLKIRANHMGKSHVWGRSKPLGMPVE